MVPEWRSHVQGNLADLAPIHMLPSERTYNVSIGRVQLSITISYSIVIQLGIVPMPSSRHFSLHAHRSHLTYLHFPV